MGYDAVDSLHGGEKPEGARMTREEFERIEAIGEQDQLFLSPADTHTICADYRRMADGLRAVEKEAWSHAECDGGSHCGTFGVIAAIARENCPPGWEE